MRIAVTGATGFIGRYIVRHIIQQGDACRGWLRREGRQFGLPQEVEWVPGELNDEDATSDLLENCDAVIHAALDRPGTGFRGAEGHIVDFAQRNIIGSLRLIEAAKRAEVRRFVLISTCAVHEIIHEDRLLDEKHPRTPLSHYGAHKAALEMFVHSYGWGEGMSICALRPTGVYGVAEPIESSKWYTLIRKIVHGETVTCRAGGKEVHASDVARAAHLLATTEYCPSGECFNCYDRYVSEFEVATLAKQMSDSTAKLDGEPKSPKHQIDTAKLQALGMRFGGDALLEQTIHQLVEHASRSLD